MQPFKPDMITNLKWLESQIKNPPVCNCAIHGDNSEALINNRCKQCWDIENANRATEDAIKDIVALKINANIPPRYRNCTFANYLANATNNRQMSAVEKFMTVDKRTNIFMTGSTGTGKTHLGTSLIHKRLIEGDKCYYINYYEIIDIKFTNKNLYERLLSVPLLFIDEFGLQDSDYKSDLLLMILDKRYANEVQTMLATNLQSEQIKNRLSDAARSRLAENFISIEFDWEDYRLTNRGK